MIGGGARRKAAALVRDKVKRVAAHLLQVDVEHITIEDSMVRVAGAADKTRSLRQIAEIAYGEPARLPAGIESGLEAQYRYDPPPMTFTSAAHACIVEVGVDTGLVKIKRWLSCEDCGTIINPALVEGQIAGGLAQASAWCCWRKPATTRAAIRWRSPTKTTCCRGFLIFPTSNTYTRALRPTPKAVSAVLAKAAPSSALDILCTGECSTHRWGLGPGARDANGTQKMIAHFTTRGDVLSGSLDSDQGSMDFQGSVSGNQPKWDMRVTKPMSITLRYELLVTGDTLAGKAKLGMFGTAEVSGRRL